MVTHILHPTCNIGTLRFRFLGYPRGDFHPRRYQVILSMDGEDIDSVEVVLHEDFIATGVVDALQAFGLSTSQYGVYHEDALDVRYHIPLGEDFTLDLVQLEIARNAA